MLAVAGGKGGCGKTTIALGVAAVLGERSPVTVVDADVDMPDLHVETATPASPGLDGLAAGEPVDGCRHAAMEYPGVSVVPAGTAADSIQRGIERLRHIDEHVIIDTPAGASVNVTVPLGIAERVVLVSTPTRESLVDVAKTAELARSLGTPIVGLVCNRSDGSIDQSVLFDCEILAHVPTIVDGRPHRVERTSFLDVVRAVSERNT